MRAERRARARAHTHAHTQTLRETESENYSLSSGKEVSNLQIMFAALLRPQGGRVDI